MENISDNSAKLTTQPDTQSLAPSTTTTLVNSDSPTTTPSSKPSSNSSKKSWLDKLKPSKPEERGKEKWRDANLSEKERWKEWQKSKDKEQKNGSTAGYFTQHYKGKGKWGYWLDAVV